MFRYDKIIDRYYPYLAMTLFAISYLIYLPHSWMITDAQSYSLQAMAFADGTLEYIQHDFITGVDSNLLKSPYNLGNAAYLAFILFLFGKQFAFFSGLVAVLGTAYILDRIIVQEKSDRSAIALLFCSLPVLFFSRSMVSGMPSMLIVALFLYVFTRQDKRSFQLLVLGFLAGLSAWFRESNALLLAPFLIHMVIKERSALPTVVVGGLLGLSIKFLSSWLVYGDPWFLSASAGFSFIPFHVLLYLFIGVILIPGGLMVPWIMAHSKKWIYIVASLGFTLFYVAYSYSAVEYSGFSKGSLLTSRFLLPLIPIIVYSFSQPWEAFPKLRTTIKISLVVLSFLTIPLSQYAFHSLFAAHEEAGKQLADNYQSRHVIYDQSGLTNIIRYINPLTGDWEHVADITTLSVAGFRPKEMAAEITPVAILSISTGNQEKMDRSEKVKSLLSTYKTTKVDSIPIDSENWLLVYEVE